MIDGLLINAAITVVMMLALCTVDVAHVHLRALSFSNARRLRLVVPPETVLVWLRGV